MTEQHFYGGWKLVAAAHRQAVIARLLRFREALECDTEPDPWTALEVPAVLFLADVCETLGLTEGEQAIVLGREALAALADELEARPIPRAKAGVLMNDRQAKALAYAEARGVIALSDYRELCPFWHDETLRLDLVNLAARGLLVKNGRTRGTYYALPGGGGVIETCAVR